MARHHSIADEQLKDPISRADELVAQQTQVVCRRTDRLFTWILCVQWFAAVAVAGWAARAFGSQALSVFGLAVFGGGLVTGIPLLLIYRFPGQPATRYAVAVAQVLWASALMEFTSGRLGSHFPVIGSLAILACYRDWRVLGVATLAYFARDVLHGDLWPVSSSAAIYEWERLAFILFEVLALVLAIRVSARESWLLSLGQARLEESNRRLEAQHLERTKSFREYTERLEAIQDELQQQARELIRARAEADEANAAKSHFVATVSHEIRTPLTAILGYTDVLLTNLTDPESVKAGSTIRRNGEFLLKLVDDILDLSKIESGKLSVETLSCSPRQIVADVVQLLQVRANAKGLPLVVRCNDDVPLEIYSDPFRLRQILLNLVSNAIKFSSHGEVRIEMSRHRDPKSEKVVFVVSDQGIGLTPRQIAKLFSPFSQADQATTRLYGGSGLGLWISKQLSNLLGGDIQVQSAPGKGSAFSVAVAIRAPSSGAAAELVSQGTSVHRTEAAVVSLDGRRVLVADDSPDNCELATFLLERSGAQVTAVGDGEQAVHAVATAKRPYDAILMDIQMPRLDGLGATQRLREQGYRGIIVALTANTRPDELQQCHFTGCDAWVSKPINSALLDLVARLCDRVNPHAGLPLA